jgi:hypothetical protein
VPDQRPIDTKVPTTTAALAASWFQRYAPDHADEAKRGQEITRQHRCECGREFTQRILSERQMAAAERLGVVGVVARQIPGFWVPVHCPPCERKDLGRQARMDEARAREAAQPPVRRSA